MYKKVFMIVAHQGSRIMYLGLDIQSGAYDFTQELAPGGDPFQVTYFDKQKDAKDVIKALPGQKGVLSIVEAFVPSEWM